MKKETIPISMRQARRWVVWNEKKIPVNPYTLRGGSSTNPATWTTFEDACAAVGKTSIVDGASLPVLGIGFVLGDGWAGIDLDGGQGHGGGAVPKAVLDDFLALGTYAERSRSGEGYHIIGRYDGPKLSGTKRDCVEIYTTARYFIMTGNALEPARDIADITATLPALHRKYIAAKPAAISRRSSGDTWLKDHIDDLLAVIPADCSRDEWFKVARR